MLGGCGVLAYELHRLTGWPLIGVSCEDEFPMVGVADAPVPDHVGVLHPSGRLLDARGLVEAPALSAPMSPAMLARIEYVERTGDEYRAAEESEGFLDGPVYEHLPEFADAPDFARELIAGL